MGSFISKILLFFYSYKKNPIKSVKTPPKNTYFSFSPNIPSTNEELIKEFKSMSDPNEPEPIFYFE
jgi:hypothetical protein